MAGKKKMMQFSPERHEFLGRQVEKTGFAAEPKKMFGHEVFFLNGYMYTGANTEGVFVHLGKEEVELGKWLKKSDDFLMSRPEKVKKQRARK